jgi:hypothetical protein
MTEEPAEIVVNAVRPDDVSLFFDMGDDCEVAFDTSQLRLLLDNLDEGLKGGKANVMKWAEVGIVPYAWSDREGPKDTHGVVILQARRGAVRLIVRFDPRSEEDDFVVTLDSDSAKRLAVLLRESRSQNRE